MPLHRTVEGVDEAFSQAFLGHGRKLGQLLEGFLKDCCTHSENKEMKR